ncbi:S1 RNA-binding domain-containing protein 1 isoform X3 [Chrysoperla carnea]|uniref:S1 RNA-binding domain-containing protein 1 isoform X3 n=1 Tax=Chrysoperla carnea TaxID=189513 RepID=UPI001D07E9E0|nr:S1 RNA-binding domain-containing protein 1 isoform X3 [Chrysoperla carnea]
MDLSSENDDVQIIEDSPKKRKTTRKVTTKVAKPTEKKVTRKRKVIESSDDDLEEKIAKPTTKKATLKLKEQQCDDLDDDKIKKPRFEYNNKFDSNGRQWTEEQWLAESNQISVPVARNIIKLFENDNSLPFIARYRRDLTNNMTPEDLRAVKESYEILINVEKKADNVLKSLKTQGMLENRIKYAVLNARTIDEIDHIYAPYKPGSKKTLAERAKELGLEEVALNYLNGTSLQDLNYVANEKQLKFDDVKDGIINIITHVVSHDTKCLENIRKWQAEARDIFIHTKMSKSKTTKEKSNIEQSEKFTNYMDFKINVNFIKPHQVLAINRGEKLKILSVKVQIPERITKLFYSFCNSNWLSKNTNFSETKISWLRTNILKDAFTNAFSKYLEPLMVRLIRTGLKATAEKASITAFENNLKAMLLTRPYQNKILGIDPGFKHGCKYALISETGDVISTGIFYPNLKVDLRDDFSVKKLKSLLEDNNCSTIALGNGTACRETEQWITELKSQNILSKNIKYTIVNESGASIYSCTEEASKEFPNMDTNIISAVSIARRLQDPLSELIKIEPKHLGVGMYQHDLKEKTLTECLDEVIMECVSFVGVNLNTASVTLLRRVCGLNQTRATNIIEHRQKISYFKNRQQLKDVKGIGDKVFEQCAGFLRVAPISAEQESSFYKMKEVNRLDRTWIHPESYHIAEKLLKKCRLNNEDIFTEKCIEKLTEILPQKENFVKEFNTTDNVLQLIFDALTKSIDHDLRLDIDQKPLFKNECIKITDLKKGDCVTGRVENVTDFGSFVDIGVGRNGLIHNSKYMGISLNLGDHVEVEILDVDIGRGRIGLALKCVLNGAVR